MSDVTRILSQIESGDPSVAEQLLPLVYDELRKLAAAKLAQEKPGQTLQATALVHEAYLRLVEVDKVQQWDSRGHFFAAAAEAMRRILVERAREKQRLKRGGDRQRVGLSIAEVEIATPDDELLALSEALDKLEVIAAVKEPSDFRHECVYTVNGPSDFHRVCLFSERRGGPCLAVARVVPHGACSSKKWVRKRAIDVAKRRPVAQGLADYCAHAARRTRNSGR